MLSTHEIDLLFLSLGILLIASHLMGRLATRLGQPAVLAELLAGILLGPTVFGAFFPQWQGILFPNSGALYTVFDGITKVAISFFLLTAGMEVDLLKALSQKRVAAFVGIGGLAVPLLTGFAACWFFPDFFGDPAKVSRLVLALFVATALSITALPVIAKILMDLNLYRTEVGLVIMTSAVFNDLAGWLIFGFLLGLVSTGPAAHANAADTFMLTLIFVLLTLTAVRWVLDKMLERAAHNADANRSVLGFVAGLSLLFSYLAGVIGIHPNFGAFVFGIAVGDSTHLSRGARTTINNFVTHILAPLFFAAIGLRINFIQQFDWRLVLVVLLLATFSKLLGCGLGARCGGFSWRQSWAVAIGMNARGAVEIILALLALQAGVITEKLFVALVVMAMVTSALSAGFMKKVAPCFSKNLPT